MNTTRARVAMARMWRGYADARRVLTRAGSTAASREIFGADRSDVGRWNDRLAVRHDSYRRTIDPVADKVTVVCVSSRPHLLSDVVADVAGQRHVDIEFVLVTHHGGFADVDIDAALQPLVERSVRCSVIDRPREASLGVCLNAGMAATDTRFVAKFDDDDRYGPCYLADSLRAHAYAGAGVVGKHSYYAFLEREDCTVLRFPANEFRYSSTLAGGTLVIDRDRTRDLNFPDISLGEDRAFLASCHRRGISTFSADRFNFVQTRSSDNTWRVGVDEFLELSTIVGPGQRLAEINR